MSTIFNNCILCNVKYIITKLPIAQAPVLTFVGSTAIKEGS